MMNYSKISQNFQKIFKSLEEFRAPSKLPKSLQKIRRSSKNIKKKLLQNLDNYRDWTLVSSSISVTNKVVHFRVAVSNIRVWVYCYCDSTKWWHRKQLPNAKCLFSIAALHTHIRASNKRFHRFPPFAFPKKKIIACTPRLLVSSIALVIAQSFELVEKTNKEKTRSKPANRKDCVKREEKYRKPKKREFFRFCFFFHFLFNSVLKVVIVLRHSS